MTVPPIETWRLTNWRNKYENEELFRRIRNDLDNDDLISLFEALETMISKGTFNSDDFYSVHAAKIVLEKVRNGNIKDFS